MDDTSKKFIEFAERELSNPVNMIILRREARWRLKDFLEIPDASLKDGVLEKLRRAADEHGEPNYTRERFLREVFDECKDMIGYILLARFLTEEKLWKEDHDS